MPTLQTARALPPLTPVETCGTCAVRDMSLCGALEGDDHKNIQEIVQQRDLAAGETLFYEFDPADSHFIVTSGCLKLSKLMADGRRQITGFMFRSDFLGLAFRDRYAYSAEAAGATRVCRFPRKQFEALLGRFPALERRLLTVASNELAAAHDQMLLLGRKTALERVASFIYILAQRDAQKVQPSGRVDLPMTRTDIADYLGLTIETVSRSLTKLKRDGVIRFETPQRVALPKRERLATLAEAGDDWNLPTSVAGGGR